MRDLARRLVHVEPHERAALAWAFAYFFCLLCGYYILRPVRDVMGIQSGIKSLPALMSATFVTMLVIAPVFGWLAARLPRARLLPAVYGFFILNLGAFYVAMTAGADPILVARTFFVWLSVFNLFVVSVFWSFMADLFTNEQAKRLFGAIAAGGSTGALCGPTITTFAVESLGVPSLMLISAAFLGACIVCIGQLARWSAERTGAPAAAAAAAAPLGGSIWAGFRLAATSPYLAALCVYILLLTWTSVVLYLEQTRIVAEAFTTSATRTQFFARIDLIVNALTLVCQLFVTNRLIERLGMGIALAVLPVVSIAGFAGMGTSPTLALLVAFAVARRVGEYAISKPAREVLFTVASREAKYKAKNFIDTAVTRGGEAASGWIVNGIKAAGASGAQLAFIALPVSVAWALVGWYLARRHDRLKAGEAETDGDEATAIARG